MANTTFNFMGFLLAHQRGKSLDKKDRNKNSLLSAFIPSDNFAGVLTPIALVDKEVAKKEKAQVESEKAELNIKVNKSNDFIAQTIQEAPTFGGDPDKGKFVFNYLQKVHPTLKVEELDNLAFYKMIDVKVKKEVIKLYGT